MDVNHQVFFAEFILAVAPGHWCYRTRFMGSIPYKL